MKYINALELINLAIKNGIIKEKDEKVFVYRKGTEKKKAGWYLEEKDLVAKELMKDKNGQEIIISELKKRNINFVLTDYSWI